MGLLLPGSASLAYIRYLLCSALTLLSNLPLSYISHSLHKTNLLSVLKNNTRSYTDTPNDPPFLSGHCSFSLPCLSSWAAILQFSRSTLSSHQFCSCTLYPTASALKRSLRPSYSSALVAHAQPPSSGGWPATWDTPSHAAFASAHLPQLCIPKVHLLLLQASLQQDNRICLLSDFLQLYLPLAIRRPSCAPTQLPCFLSTCSVLKPSYFPLTLSLRFGRGTSNTPSDFRHNNKESSSLDHT